MIAYIEPPYRQDTRDRGYCPLDGTVTLTFPTGGSFTASTIYVGPSPEPYYDDRETRLTLKRTASKAAVLRARLALQRALDDPRPEIPLEARKRPYRRPTAKGRVCAGSSRYRVMV